MLVAAWLGLRRAVHARLWDVSLRCLLLDAAPLLLAWLWLMILSARPLLASAIVLGASFGLVWGNRAKLRATDEPLVFTDGSSANVLLYPSLCAGVIDSASLAACLFLVACAITAWLWAEPAMFGGPLPTVLCVGVAALAWWRPPSAAVLLRLAGKDNVEHCTLVPAADAIAYGPLSAVILHGAIAARERHIRQGACRPGQSHALPAAPEYGGPTVMLQLESFFDARRAWSDVPSDLLPHFDRCRARSHLHGRLSTSAWGANTVRTEFAALTGLSDSALGADRFNPYVAFARVPVDSIAWRLRAAGYHTVCVHPFDRRFYGRDVAMHNLGFVKFIDIAAFEIDPNAPRYVADIEMMRMIEHVLQRCGPKTFVFGISIGNHSPWSLPQGFAAEGVEAMREAYLHGLRQTDAALGTMQRSLDANWPEYTLTAFGDHQPSLTERFAQVGMKSRLTDYVVTSERCGRAERLDIAAHDLPRMMLDCMASEAQKVLF